MNEACAQIEEMLSDFLEGALAPGDAATFSSHLLTCRDCSHLASQVRDLTGMMHELDEVPEPRFLANKIVSATLGSRESGWRRWLSWPSLIWQPQFAMGAVTVVASLVILLHATVGSTENLTLANLNPASVARVANRHVHLAYAHGVRFVNDLRFVYQIESLLAPSEPANVPANPEQPSPSLDPRQKSKTIPRGNGQIEARRTLATDFEASLIGPAYPYRSTP